MADTDEPRICVTLAEIARIAGVGRAAVSNWRRRHESFPAPVGGSDTSPQFDLVQIEQWLRAQGRLGPSEGGRERLWPQFESLGDRESMGLAIAEVGAQVRQGHSTEQLPAAANLSDAQRRAVELAVTAAKQDGGSETFDFLLTRWLGTHVRQVATTPAPLASLMAELAEIAGKTSPPSPNAVCTVLDPACGVGSLLLAAAVRWGASTQLRLLGQDSDPVLANLAAARLLLGVGQDGGTPGGVPTDIRVADTLRADLQRGARAGVVLCNPPFNERDWGHAELATDPRWTFGHPPRTEPELAWVQHALACLAPGGTAVMLLPPAVASRKAGRRIRAALLRGGALRAVIALPPGAAHPHGVALHLWLLRAPAAHDSAEPADTLLLVDAAQTAPHNGQTVSSGQGKAGLDWAGLRETVLSAVRAHAASGAAPVEQPPGSIAVPVMDLLDDQVDLTPARHVPAAAAVAGMRMRRSWDRFRSLLGELEQLAAELSRLGPSQDGGTAPGMTTIGDLLRAGAVSLRPGQSPADGLTGSGEAPPGAVPMLTVADILAGGKPGGWLPKDEASAGGSAGTLTVTAPEEIVVVGVARAFDVWVDVNAPTVLGPQLYALRADPSVVDPWFLAGCLRAPANARQAGTHASTSSRIDVRRLQVPRMPLDEQRRYGEVFRRLISFEESLQETGIVGADLVSGLSDSLAAGRLPRA